MGAVKALLGYGADVNISDRHGLTPIQNMAYYGARLRNNARFIEIGRMLMEKGAVVPPDVVVDENDEYGEEDSQDGRLHRFWHQVLA